MQPTSTNRALLTPVWPVKNILAFSTTKLHPHAEHVNTAFGNFNLGLHVGDDKKHVESNRACLAEFLPENTKIQWLEQIHSADVHFIDQHTQTPLVGDALITRQKGIALAVMTADCLPILMSDGSGSQIAAIHGGWRCLAAGIIEKTLAEFSAQPSDICVWLGPCIGANFFEVGEDVFSAFFQLEQSLTLAFKPLNHDKYLCDLQRLAQLQLHLLGVRNLTSLSHCTYTQKEDYYSYRREQTTGRMASLICLR